jgi:CBS-domain-containing membrane protein
MHKLKNLIAVALRAYQSGHGGLREKLISSVTACLSILILLLVVQYVELGLPFKMLVLASMGASAFLLFVTPHSPMAQPWPVIAGHLISAFIGVACAQWISNAPLAAAVAALMVMLAIVLNNLVPGRRYPMLHSHHAHHNQFLQQHQQHSELLEADFKWALSQMDGLIDVSAEDLVDIYEFALERAQSRRQQQVLSRANDDYS